jgi:HK97 family phage portal protein
MRTLSPGLRDTINRLAPAERYEQKAMPKALAGPQWSGSGWTSSGQKRAPTNNELIAQLKATAWTCASLNAQTCATYAPKLYVATSRGQAQAKCGVRPLERRKELQLRSSKTLQSKLADAEVVQEVIDHPLLDLLATVNPLINSFELWELTTLYQEIYGSSYWYLSYDKILGIPTEIWIMPTQNMTPKREPDSKNIVDYYEYRVAKEVQRFDPAEIIHFRYPDPADPYTKGLSPLQACFEQVSLASDYAAFKTEKFANHAIPDAILSPEEVIGEDERDRLEIQWNQRMRKGGAGRVIVADQKMNLSLMSHSMGDMAALADAGMNKELICNAFLVPVPMFTTNTNLANLQASQMQHSVQAIVPRLARRDEKINEQLIPLFDPSGRLFMATDDPKPKDPTSEWREQQQDMASGVRTINEVRAEKGLQPVDYGKVPWVSAALLPMDLILAKAQIDVATSLAMALPTDPAPALPGGPPPDPAKPIDRKPPIEELKPAGTGGA